MKGRNVHASGPSGSASASSCGPGYGQWPGTRRPGLLQVQVLQERRARRTGTHTSHHTAGRHTIERFLGKVVVYSRRVEVV